MIYKIVIICQFGASSCLLVDRMQKAAKDQGVRVQITACSELQSKPAIDNADIVLVAPQVRFRVEKIRAAQGFTGTPVMNIETEDYGNMDGSKILGLAIDEVEQARCGSNVD